MGSCEIDFKYVNGWPLDIKSILKYPLDNSSWTSTIPPGLAPGQYVRLRLLSWSIVHPYFSQPPSFYGTKCAFYDGLQFKKLTTPSFFA